MKIAKNLAEEQNAMSAADVFKAIVIKNTFLSNAGNASAALRKMLLTSFSYYQPDLMGMTLGKTKLLGAAIFIIIVVEPRRPLSGAIRDARPVKTPLGEAVARRLREIGEFPGIRLSNSVVMTDHVHLRLHLRAGLAGLLTTRGRALGRFKSLCAKDYHEICGFLMTPLAVSGRIEL